MAQTHHTVRSLDEIKDLIADHGDEEGILVRLGRTIPKLSEAPAMAKRLREMKDNKGWVIVDLKGLEPLVQISGDLFHASRSLAYIIDITAPIGHAPTEASTSAVDVGNKVEPDPAQRARFVAEKLRLGKRSSTQPSKPLRIIDGGKVDPDPGQRPRLVAEELRMANRSSTYSSEPLRTNGKDDVPTNRLVIDATRLGTSHSDEFASKGSLLSPKRRIDAKRLGTSHSDDFSSFLSPKRRIDATRLGTCPTGPDDVSSKASISAKRRMDKSSPKQLRTHQDERRGNRSLEFSPAHSPEKLAEKHVRRSALQNVGPAPTGSLSAERHSTDRPKGRFVTPQRARGVHAIGAKLLKAPILSVSNVGDRLKKLGLDLLRDEKDVAHLRAELIACKKDVVAVWNSKVSLI